MLKKPIYLDFNATTPIDPLVAKAMLPYLYENFGNPSSNHVYGVAAKMAVENARREVAMMLGCLAEEIIFTSGGSESNNLAIKGCTLANRGKGNHIITSTIEHPAVLEVCSYLESEGFRVSYLPVDNHGRVEPEDVQAAITDSTILISIMHANNEVGTIQPIKAISTIAHSHNILMHTDAAQSAGKIPVNVNDLGVDLLSIAGHKLYAPKGIGVLYIRTGTELNKQIHGAAHEHNLRAGTENVLEIAGLGRACSLVSENLGSYAAHMRDLRDRLEAGINNALPLIKINGHLDERLPNTSSISFKGLEANTLLSELDGVAASAGAACHAEHVDVSHVLAAMQIPMEYAMGTIRFSTGRSTTIDEIDRAVSEITMSVRRLEPESDTEIVIEGSEKIKLTQFTHGLGCACKMRPQLLEKIIQGIPTVKDSRIFVGTETADDAAVFLIRPDCAVVQTVDFFTPVVDDPFMFGEISAVNSLSDVYAMGARPLFALNIVGFPVNRLSIGVLEDILKGAAAKAAEAGIAIIGGHTIDSTEPIFGLAVTGEVNPDKIWTNRNAQIGDVLLLTKPIGTGILTTAFKQGFLKENDLQQALVQMRDLNKDAAEIASVLVIHACTDITGFGLLGHLLGMLKASGVSAEIDSKNIPLLDFAYDLAAAGAIPGGSKSNQAFTESSVIYAPGIPTALRSLLNDAQTSGGLLFSLPKNQAMLLAEKLESHGRPSKIIGTVIKDQQKKISVY